jgi:hypothetical protein
MVFGKDYDAFYKTQGDIVDAEGISKPEYVTEEMKMPALTKTEDWSILQMGDTDMIDLFGVILKSRTNISEVEFCLGDYSYKTVPANTPRAKELHNLSYLEAATAMVMALSSNPMCVGFKSKIENKEGKVFSSIVLYISKKKFSADDKEFKPSIRVTYAPAGF